MSALQTTGSLLWEAGHPSASERAEARVRAGRAIAAALERQATGECTAVLLVGIDHFDTFATAVGSDVAGYAAAEVARRLGSMASTATSEHVGDGTFVLLVEHASDELTRRIGRRALANVARPIRVGGREIALSACAGIATTALTSTNVGGVIADARHALRVAASGGRGQLHILAEDERQDALSEMLLAGDLSRAVASGQFRLHYQPIVNLSDQRVIGVEALVRWEHPDLGLLSPDRFLALAERTGTMTMLGAWVVETACREAARWPLLAGGPPPTVTVNVSSSELADSDFGDHVRAALDESGVAPDRLCLEVSELAAPAAIGAAEHALLDVAESGVGVAIDDFGIGFSSLERLRLMPTAHLLKLDRSFIADVVGDDRHREIVMAVASLADGLGLTLVAEGVETVEQRHVLRAIGCQYGQGFLFARPLSGDALTELLAAQPTGGVPKLAQARFRRPPRIDEAAA